MSQRMPDYETLRAQQARTQEVERAESICGETSDHVDRITYEDHETQTWECTRCGAEWWHDKEVAK